MCAVLDGGVVAEFGPPHELLQREGSTAVFRSLVDETGPDYAATLKHQAAQVQCGAHHKNRGSILVYSKSRRSDNKSLTYVHVGSRLTRATYRGQHACPVTPLARKTRQAHPMSTKPTRSVAVRASAWSTSPSSRQFGQPCTSLESSTATTVRVS